MKHIQDGPPSMGEFILSVVYSSTHYPHRLIVSLKETIADLKQFCASWLHSYVDEMDVFIRRDFPYPLSDEMCLGQLHDEHRTLFIHTRDPSCKRIPLRFILEETDEKGEQRILDLTTLPPAWIIHVDRWLHEDPHFHEIHLDGEQEDTNDILYTLGEIVRTLPQIRCIRIHGGNAIRVHAEALAYLRYHLAADQYRTEEVHIIWGDGV